VLDDAKHYWVSPDEVDKLIRAGSGWLSTHPERELITTRYLRHQRALVESAIDRLAALDDLAPTENEDVAAPDEVVAAEDDAPRPISLADQRRDGVLAALAATGAGSVVDLGCGEGKLLRILLKDPRYQRILGIDVSHRSLEIAARRLRLDQLTDRVRQRIELRQSALTYRDAGLTGFDAAVLMEVIEHLDPPRLPALAENVFGSARPGAVLVTTPNVEYNAVYELAEGTTRHGDHRFEWNRRQFRDWADGVAERYGYDVEHRPIGPEDPDLGPPTQLALFRRRGGDS
jgi:3' terminal RNA ribose 2'-O-methyltransferase Hen1